MNDTQRILDLANFMEGSQGYVDINYVHSMTGIPALVVANVLEQNGYFESGVKGQYQKA